MSHCVSHEQCPKCRSLGNDRNGDNLGRYSDGSAYCFSCGYFESAKGLPRLQKKDETTTKAIGLPGDVDGILPEKAWNFLSRYAITNTDAKRNTILWSESWQRVIFPIFDNTGLLAWQGRYLGDNPDKPKWYSVGDLKNIFHIIGGNKDKIVLTEDIISAISVAKQPQFCAMPLFGSYITARQLLTIKNICGKLEVYIWLDKDKQKEAVKFANLGTKLGIKTHTVITNKDPKEYTQEEIQQWLYKFSDFC